MKLLLLTVCCVIATSLAGPFSDKEEKLEAALNDIEVVLQDLNKNKDVSDEEYLGDLPRRISVVRAMEEMLLHTENIEMATAEIESLGGRVAIQLGNDLLIANMPAEIASKQDAFAHASAQIPTTASAATRSNAKAYEMYREDKLGPQPKVQKWTEKTAPKSFPRESPYPADSPYTQTMRGKIAVVVLVASGPGSLAVSNSEYENVKSQVMGALKFWTDKAPHSADLSFAQFSAKATINALNGPVGCSKVQCEDKFAIPTYKSIGFTSKDNAAQWPKIFQEQLAAL